MFAAETTLDSLRGAAYGSVFEAIPLAQRITHPGSHGFPDATFDYLFGKNVRMGKAIITPTNVSDHLPVTCDVEFQREATRLQGHRPEAQRNAGLRNGNAASNGFASRVRITFPERSRFSPAQLG